MNRAFKVQPSQETASVLPAQSGPTLLDTRDLSRVAGGLPRGGGGWIEPQAATTLSTQESASYDLPRGGGGW